MCETCEPTSSLSKRQALELKAWQTVDLPSKVENPWGTELTASRNKHLPLWGLGKPCLETGQLRGFLVDSKKATPPNVFHVPKTYLCLEMSMKWISVSLLPPTYLKGILRWEILLWVPAVRVETSSGRQSLELLTHFFQNSPGCHAELCW